MVERYPYKIDVLGPIPSWPTMKTVSLEEIETIAKQLAQEKKQWHYHLLTPTCQFNEATNHAFVLENSSDQEYYVYYSDEPAMALGKRLLGVLHGEDILAQKTTDVLSPAIENIIRKARELNTAGKFWHHHVFFPLCRYNRHPGKWNITFENQQEKEVLESLSDTNPKQDQKEIERLYYQQKTLT